jgi:hypothetical protein
MIEGSLAFALCGAAGATIYSFPIYLKGLKKVPPAEFGIHNLLFSVAVGAVCAAMFTRIIGFNFPWTIDPEPWPLALVVGLGSNPIVPILLRKLEQWANAFEGKK